MFREEEIAYFETLVKNGETQISRFTVNETEIREELERKWKRHEGNERGEMKPNIRKLRMIRDGRCTIAREVAQLPENVRTGKRDSEKFSRVSGRLTEERKVESK